MTRGNQSDLQPFDPEIDKTFHRFVRHSVHPTFPEHFVPFERPEHSVIGDFEHPDFEHYNFEHSKNMA